MGRRCIELLGEPSSMHLCSHEYAGRKVLRKSFGARTTLLAHGTIKSVFGLPCRKPIKHMLEFFLCRSGHQLATTTPLFEACLADEPFWDHFLPDPCVGLLAPAAAACSGPLSMSQSGNRFLYMAGGLFETGGVVERSSRLGNRWTSGTLPVIDIARRRTRQLDRGVQADHRRLRYHLRAFCSSMRARAGAN